MAALSVAGLYSIITTLASLYAIKNPALKAKLLLYFILWDAVINPINHFSSSLQFLFSSTCLLSFIYQKHNKWLNDHASLQLILGIIASATGTAGGVAYVGLKGNKHVNWNKICNVYDKFCRHVGASVAVALFGSIVTVLLIWISAYSLHSRVPK